MAELFELSEEELRIIWEWLTQASQEGRTREDQFSGTEEYKQPERDLILKLRLERFDA